MSLDLLVGPLVQVVVFIKEGQGFGFLKSPITVSATLLGHILTTDVEPSSADPTFRYELTYEISKKLVKKLRVENTSLKIDCYSVISGQKNRIGYIRLNLKQLQVVAEGLKMMETWYRLLGISREARVLEPQLLVSFYVTDIPKDDPKHNDLQLKPSVWKKSHDPNNVTVYIKKDEGIIQLGSSKICSNFTVTVNVVSTNIMQLIPIHSEFSSVSVIYSLLGYTVQTKAVKGVNGSFLPDEKVAIQLRTTNKYLQEVSKQLKVHIKLMFGKNEIGTTYFYLKDISRNMNNTYEVRCLLIPCNPEFVQLYSWIDLAVHYTKENNVLKKPMNLHTIVKHRRDKKGRNYRRPETRKPPSNQKFHTISMPSIRLDRILGKPCPRSAPGGTTYRASQKIGRRRSYVLAVTLNSIQLCELPKGDGKFVFRFEHPDVDIRVHSSCEVVVNQPNVTTKFNPIRAEFYLKLPMIFHHNALIAQSPKVIVSSEGKDIATAYLHLGILFTHYQKECCYSAVLEGESGKKGILGIKMSVVDWSYQMQSQSPMCVAGQSLLSLHPKTDMKKVVEELEDWKDKQQEMFKAELVRKEQEYFAKVTADWEKTQLSLTEDLVLNIENSQTVFHSLNKATENLRLRELKLKEKEHKLLNETKELRENFKKKAAKLRRELEAAKKEEVSKISMSVKDQVDNLEKKMKSLEERKELLEETVHVFEESNTKNKEKLFNREQSQGIIKELEVMVERYEKEKQSKIFYKTEWAKSVREQYRLNRLNKETLTKHVVRNTDELHNVTVQNIASTHEKALEEDQQKLLELKSKVLAWNRRQGDSARSQGTGLTTRSGQSGSQICAVIKDYPQNESLSQTEECLAVFE